MWLELELAKIHIYFPSSRAAGRGIPIIKVHIFKQLSPPSPLFKANNIRISSFSMMHHNLFFWRMKFSSFIDSAEEYTSAI